MSMLKRILTITFSLCIHGSVVVLALILPDQKTEIPEIVYRVSLAEFAAPVHVEPPPKVDIPEPPEPPKPEPPKPKPVEKVQPKKIEPKMISAKKRKSVPKKVVEAKPEPPKVTQPVAQPPVEVVPVPVNYGGLQAYREDVVDQRPSISRRASPKYPTRARRMNIQGQVIVRLIVDTSGIPQQCTIYSSNPKDIFDDAALSAVKKTRFIPGKVKGNKVNTVVLIPYQFTLR